MGLLISIDPFPLSENAIESFLFGFIFAPIIGFILLCVIIYSIVKTILE